jgi:hypothetical protein
VYGGTYQVAVLQPHKLLRAHVLVHALVVCEDALAVSGCLVRYLVSNLYVLRRGKEDESWLALGYGIERDREEGALSRTSTPHLAAALANFSMGRWRPAMVGMADWVGWVMGFRGRQKEDSLSSSKLRDGGDWEAGVCVRCFELLRSLAFSSMEQ